MPHTKWSHLSRQRLGKYAEYFAKMEFTWRGFDVYTSEVDDKAIDFVIRKNHSVFYDVQVKSLRTLNYCYFQKSSFEPRQHLFAVLVLFLTSDPPDMYLIPSEVWLHPNRLFVSRDYIGKKSVPEWGIQLSRATLPTLQSYRFEETIKTL